MTLEAVDDDLGLGTFLVPNPAPDPAQPRKLRSPFQMRYPWAVRYTTFDEESIQPPSSQDKTMNIVKQPSPQEVAESENEEYGRGRKRHPSQGAENSAIGDGAPTIESWLVVMHLALVRALLAPVSS